LENAFGCDSSCLFCCDFSVGVVFSVLEGFSYGTGDVVSAFEGIEASIKSVVGRESGSSFGADVGLECSVGCDSSR